MLISFRDHHIHSHYIISHAELLGFNHTGSIKTAKFTSKDEKKVVLSLRSEGESDLDRWGIESVVRDFEKERKLYQRINLFS
nr:hypothetical protein BSM_19090 [uncultured archaeon]